MRKSRLMSFAAASVILTQSCTTASFRIPNNRFQSPENGGKLGDGILAIGYGSKTSVTVADGKLATDEAIRDSAELIADDGIFLQASAGLHPMFELFFNNGAAGFKFQALGNTASEAKMGNFSLSLGLAVDQGSNSSSSTLVGDLTYTLKTKASYMGFDAMLLSGYRIADNHLLYANVASANFTATGSITREYTSGVTAGTSTKVTVPKRKVRETSVLVGWQGHSNQVYLMIEGGYSLAGMEDTRNKERLVFGSTLGVRL